MSGELLPGLRCLRNSDNTRRALKVVNYYLDYSTSETLVTHLARVMKVNYYLDYGTSETCL